MAAGARHGFLRAIPPWAWAVLGLVFAFLAVVFVQVVLPWIARLLIAVRGSPVGPL